MKKKKRWRHKEPVQCSGLSLSYAEAKSPATDISWPMDQGVRRARSRYFGGASSVPCWITVVVSPIEAFDICCMKTSIHFLTSSTEPKLYIFVFQMTRFVPSKYAYAWRILPLRFPKKEKRSALVLRYSISLSCFLLCFLFFRPLFFLLPSIFYFPFHF